MSDQTSNPRFRLGQRITGYCTDGEAFTGYIVGFAGEKKKTGPLARVRCENNTYAVAKLNTCHPMDVDTIKHKKNTFLAAASRVSPVLYFKNDKARRDFLEALWTELADFTDKD